MKFHVQAAICLLFFQTSFAYIENDTFEIYSGNGKTCFIGSDIHDLRSHEENQIQMHTIIEAINHILKNNSVSLFLEAPFFCNCDFQKKSSFSDEEDFLQSIFAKKVTLQERLSAYGDDISSFVLWDLPTLILQSRINDSDILANVFVKNIDPRLPIMCVSMSISGFTSQYIREHSSVFEIQNLTSSLLRNMPNGLNLHDITRWINGDMQLLINAILANLINDITETELLQTPLEDLGSNLYAKGKRLISQILNEYPFMEALLELNCICEIAQSQSEYIFILCGKNHSIRLGELLSKIGYTHENPIAISDL